MRFYASNVKIWLSKMRFDVQKRFYYATYCFETHYDPSVSK